ncbi:MAG: type II toxin-antitoxin system VapC family toxin [Pseudomonadota bacterium]
MIVLDTNVVSELMKNQPDVRVDTWIKRQFREDVFLASITLAEVFYGTECMDASKRKAPLESKVKMLIAVEFSGQILPFDEAAARQYAVIAAGRKRMGRPISEFNAQIAAIAAAHGASVATRNIADFEHCGIVVINPWAE